MVESVLVIGGGIAGIRSALDLAEKGYDVHLVEKDPSIGGRMAQLEKTFPTLDCSLCILAPHMVDIGRHENVQLHTFSELVDLGGDPGNFTAEILKKPRGVDLDKCTGCERCSERCPIDVPSEYDVGVGERSAIYVPFPQAVPKAAVIDFENCIDCGLCEEVCEADAITRDQESERINVKVGAVIVATGFEEYDPRNGQPEYNYKHPNVITMLELERLLCASGPTQGEVKRPGDGKRPKKVAVLSCVGSRDSRIDQEYCSRACCMFSAKNGILLKEHNPEVSVTVFNIGTRAYGKGFENFIDRAKEEYGVNYVRARPAGIRSEGEELVVKYEKAGTGEVMEEKFDLVALAAGMVPPKGQDKLLKILELSEAEEDGFIRERDKATAPLETEREGIYLAGVAQGPKDIPDSVSQALGAAAKASSLLGEEGKKKTSGNKEYPPMKDVTGERPRVGVFVCHCGNNIAGTVDVEEVEEEASKIQDVVHVERNFYMCSDEGTNSIKDAIEEKDLNRVVVASCTPRTHEPLFQETCREAGLNPYLFEMANIRDQCSWVHSDEPERATEKAVDLVRMSVERSRRLESLERTKVKVNRKALVIGGGPAGMQASIDLANQGFPVHLVEKEERLGGKLHEINSLPNGKRGEEILDELASEVRQNDLISVYLGKEVKEFKGHVGEYTATLDSGKSLEFGTSIVAIGSKEHPIPEWWDSDKTYTQLEFEEFLESHSNLGSTAFVQCVDQRNEERECSRFCCMNSIRQASRIKEKDSEAPVFILYRDIQAFGRNHEQEYRKTCENGVRFIRFEEDAPPKLGDGVIKVRDLGLNREIELDVNNIVVATGSDPPECAEELSRLLKISLDDEGYFLEAHPKLRPVDTATDGIYLAGGAQGPKDLTDAMCQASGAAMRAAVPLARGFVELEPTIPVVDKESCTGCGVCASLCPYSAIEIEEGTAEIEETLCKGCGTCVSTCSNRALDQNHFSNEQITAELKAFGG